jgi:hypothetical protein
VERGISSYGIADDEDKTEYYDTEQEVLSKVKQLAEYLEDTITKLYWRFYCNVVADHLEEILLSLSAQSSNESSQSLVTKPRRTPLTRRWILLRRSTKMTTSHSESTNRISNTISAFVTQLVDCIGFYRSSFKSLQHTISICLGSCDIYYICCCLLLKIRQSL